MKVDDNGLTWMKVDPDSDSDAVTPSSCTRSYTCQSVPSSHGHWTVIFVLLTSAIVAVLLWMLISAKGF